MVQLRARTFLATSLFVLAWTAAAAEVIRPAEVTGLRAERVGADVRLTWTAVTVDASGHPETVAEYRIYRGLSPSFLPDTVGGTNEVGTSPTTSFDDLGAAPGIDTYFYLVSAVDASGNESATRPSTVLTPPVLSGSWTDSTIELSWTPAAPASDVTAYRVYYGRAPAGYEFVQDVGLDTSVSLIGLELFAPWYAAVTAVDARGNESAFSNEHFDAVAGRVRLRAQDEDALCWEDADDCPPDPGEIKRNGGWQHLKAIDFPPGDWTRVLVTYTLDSRLCSPPAQGTVTKCGEHPDQGGWNPCGDPWDRLAHLFLVLDDCVASGGSCITPNNLELMRAITPFGTDAPPPDGTGFVDPRALTLDVTPFAPLMTGVQRWIGAEIVNFTQAGWWVTVQFELSERLDETSAKKPADGIAIVGFGGAPLPTRQVAIPASANAVWARLFTTGHGGSQFCDGGSNNGGACTSGAQCPGGVCNPCDEFCHRTNRILRDGTAIWTGVPWRTDCSPSGNQCSNWNACGFPSCTFPRAGWCPGYIACTGNGPCDNDIKLTNFLAPGGTYNLSYDVQVQRGSWPISLVVYWYIP